MQANFDARASPLVRQSALNNTLVTDTAKECRIHFYIPSYCKSLSDVFKGVASTADKRVTERLGMSHPPATSDPILPALPARCRYAVASAQQSML